MLTATAAEAGCTIGKLVDLPVTMAGLRPMVSAAIDGHAVRLLVDSGAFYSILTPGTATELGLRLQAAPGFTIAGVAGSGGASITSVKEFRISGYPIRNLKFLVAGNETGGAGVLGQNFLSFHDAEYDLANGTVRMMTATGCDRANLAYWAGGKPSALVRLEELKPYDRHIVGTVFVNGIAMRAIFDTGAPSSALTVAAAERAGVRLKDPGVEATGFTFGGIGRGRVRTWTAPFRSFAPGEGEEVRNTRLQIGDFRNLGADMLVGADFFLSHRVYVANTLRRMFITYNGGPVFRLDRAGDDGAPPSATAAAAPPSVPATPGSDAGPDDADGLARRGAASAARNDLPRALADLDRAVALAPKDARIRTQRARIHLAMRHDRLAAADLDEAVTLQPDDADARLLRAELRLRGSDPAGARADLDAVAGAVARASDMRLALGQLYDRLDALPEAIGQLDLWIAAHPNDIRRATALNDRCWFRALAGKDLPLALTDCDAALRLAPRAAPFLDSRGLVRLRMGDPAKAIADYDRALAAEPTLAWSRYGRGVARLREGQRAAGEADVAAALAIDPTLAERARRYGIVPPG